MEFCSFILRLPLRLMQQSFSNRDSYTDGGGSGTGDESPKSVSSSFVQDKDFILDCLCWHNEYRARHSAPALTVSPEVSKLLNFIYRLYKHKMQELVVY